VVVLGHNPGCGTEVVGESVIIRAGGRGNHVGSIRFEPGRPIDFSGGILGLDKDVLKDTYIDSLVSAFEKPPQRPN
jgi:hypothetical protein